MRAPRHKATREARIRYRAVCGNALIEKVLHHPFSDRAYAIALPVGWRAYSGWCGKVNFSAAADLAVNLIRITPRRMKRSFSG
jgi:hypothetical protein